MTDRTSTTITFDGAPIQALLGGRYELIERIGKGGMAEVFRALDIKLQRNVAVKIMLPEFANDAEFAQRFRAEARAAAQLASPYAVTVHDSGEDQGRHYIVMQLVEGDNLKATLARTGPLAPRAVAEIGYQTCLALAQAHATGIVHRDVKPANIMLSRGGDTQPLIAQITDFGIAQAERFMGGQSEDGRIMGTPRYMSPEQFRGEAGTPLSDIYSLGAVMYEAACGCPPFLSTDRMELAELHAGTAPVPVQQLAARVDDDLDSIIMTALAKNPDMRFASANAMAQALSNYLGANEHSHRFVSYPRNWVVGFAEGPEDVRGGIFEVGDVCIIGRSNKADVIVADSTVSRAHVRLIPRGAFLQVDNLSSSNGTRVNGAIVTGGVLVQAGAECAMGRVRFKIGRRIG